MPEINSDRIALLWEESLGLQSGVFGSRYRWPVGFALRIPHHVLQGIVFEGLIIGVLIIVPVEIDVEGATAA